ncbi:MAG: FHA domain-containing protein [Chloroflexota bacterium]
MSTAEQAILLAKISWDDPQSGETLELLLPEGGTASIGRLESNNICIKEQHVSRQHATIEYRDGVFVITDLGSANGVYVNDQRLSEPYPLLAGDTIRLYVPLLRFEALDEKRQRTATEKVGDLIPGGENRTRLIITNGPQQGSSIALLLNSITIGRATNKADWEIALQDPSVSRPHARLDLIDDTWVLYDLGSVNGTLVNGTAINEKGRVLHDGDQVNFGATSAEFRSG